MTMDEFLFDFFCDECDTKFSIHHNQNDDFDEMTKYCPFCGTEVIENFEHE